MALRIITGVPGAGKTYYAVNHLVKNYCDAFGDTFELRENSLIVTNIDELLLDSVDLKTSIDKVGSFEKFFSIEVQKKISEKYQKLGKSVVYVIDESQQFFHRRFYDRDVFGFFETHRHYGMDIYLITQNVNLLAKDLISLAEYEIRAVPRTLSIGGFNYLKKSNREIIGRSFLRKDKKIFKMYTSMTGSETEKITSPYLKYIIPIIFLFAFGFYGLKNSFFGRSMGWSETKTANASTSVPVSPSSKKQPPSSLTQIASDSVKRPIPVIEEKRPFVQVSFVKVGSKIQVYNPVTNNLVPVSVYPYEIQAIDNGKSLCLYARLPDLSRKR